jgi:hypothetical protein
MALINPGESKRTKLDAATPERERGTPSSPLLLLIELPVQLLGGLFGLWTPLISSAGNCFFTFCGGFFSPRLKNRCHLHMDVGISTLIVMLQMSLFRGHFGYFM